MKLPTPVALFACVLFVVCPRGAHAAKKVAVFLGRRSEARLQRRKAHVRSKETLVIENFSENPVSTTHHSGLVTLRNQNRNIYADWQNAKIVDVFYNVWVGPTEVYVENARRIVNEQLASLAARETKGDVIFNIKAVTLGQQIADLLVNCSRCTVLAHYETGFEDKTLTFLHEHCKANRTSYVMYIHNKGSFHDSLENNMLRRFLMKGVLTNECLHATDVCTTCSSRFSPIPHPHTPGNMWLAKCDYVSTLLPPENFEHVMNALIDHPVVPMPYDCPSGMGTQRYSNEHWVLSAPTVVPCDVYGGSEYRWAYEGCPDDTAPWTPVLHEGIRFPLASYDIHNQTDLQTWSNWRCHEYQSLYHQSPSDNAIAALGMDACPAPL